jgi:hypothetical protein
MANARPLQHLPNHPLLHHTQNPAATTTLPQHTDFHPTAITIGNDTAAPPLSYNDVYIDDFMIIAQRPQHRYSVIQQKRTGAARYRSPNWTKATLPFPQKSGYWGGMLTPTP